MDRVPSSNDIKLAAKDVVNHMEVTFGTLPDERRGEVEKMLENLVYDNPPLGPDWGPCNHGYENKYWCARCVGTIDEALMPVKNAPNIE